MQRLIVTYGAMNVNKIACLMFFGLTSTIAASYSCLCTQYDSDDLATLLGIRDSLDPSGTALTSWNSSYTCTNGFTGVYCDTDGKVNAIILYNSSISGVLPSSIGDLSALQQLNISRTKLTGPIPSTISNLVHLDTLHFYDNYINETIPDVFDTLTNLTYVDFGYNLLRGKLPKSLGSLSKLQYLNLELNRFSGPIPEEIGSLTNLQDLRLRINFLSGPVPSTLSARCSSFAYANVSLNCLTLDSTTDSCSALPLKSSSVCYSYCDAAQSGGACAGHGTCTSLLGSYYCICDSGYVSSASSPFTCSLEGVGPAPAPAIAPISSPPSFYSPPPPPSPIAFKQCDCQNFTADDITVLLTIRPILDPYGLLTDWDPSFSCSNGWFGVYCDSTSRVNFLFIQSVPLKGFFPPLLSNLTGLSGFSFYNTSLQGAIPSSLASLPKLAHIYLGYNSLTGSIPEEIFAMPSLQNLSIPNSGLTGSIPNALSNLKSIILLDLSENNLIGSIPTEVATLTTLRVLKLNNNSFLRSIPAGIGDLPDLSDIDLSNNYLSGEIPSEIKTKCGQYNGFSLYENCLTVSDSESCNSTTPQRDEVTCFSYCNGRQAGGSCGGHGNCRLQYSPFQASCDCDSGYEIVNNDFLCVGTSSSASPPPPPVRVMSNFSPPLTRSSGSLSVIGGSIGGSVALLIIIAALFCLLRHCQNVKYYRSVRLRATKLTVPTISGEVVDVGNGRFTRRFTLREISAATNNFSEELIIGKGGFGCVYVGSFSEGEKWAVKQSRQRIFGDEISTFETEVKLIACVSHGNLVALKGFCDEGGEQILVYELVPNGNLRQYIEGQASNKVLSMEDRIKIATDAARGLDYLHHFEKCPIIHCDVKSENILIGEQLTAKVSDFGLLKSMDAAKTHVSADVMGTLGYLDPEYAKTMKVSTKSDVYSFGVVLLELVTGRKCNFISPTESDSDESTYESLPFWARHTWDKDNLIDFVDPLLGSNYHSDIVNKVVQLALHCTKLEGKMRPSMRDVLNLLEEITHENKVMSGLEGNKYVFGDVEHESSIGGSSSNDGIYLYLSQNRSSGGSDFMGAPVSRRPVAK